MLSRGSSHDFRPHDSQSHEGSLLLLHYRTSDGHQVVIMQKSRSFIKDIRAYRSVIQIIHRHWVLRWLLTDLEDHDGLADAGALVTYIGTYFQLENNEFNALCIAGAAWHASQPLPRWS